MHCGQRPQKTCGMIATRSPGRTLRISAPNASTTLANLWPKIVGRLTPVMPWSSAYV
jgi:hypothetical protein